MIYQSSGLKKDWRWRLVSGENRIVAVSGDGYPDKQACLAATDLLASQSATPHVHYVQ